LQTKINEFDTDEIKGACEHVIDARVNKIADETMERFVHDLNVGFLNNDSDFEEKENEQAKQTLMHFCDVMEEFYGEKNFRHVLSYDNHGFPSTYPVNQDTSGAVATRSNVITNCNKDLATSSNCHLDYHSGLDTSDSKLGVNSSESSRTFPVTQNQNNNIPNEIWATCVWDDTSDDWVFTDAAKKRFGIQIKKLQSSKKLLAESDLQFGQCEDLGEKTYEQLKDIFISDQNSTDQLITEYQSEYDRMDHQAIDSWIDKEKGCICNFTKDNDEAYKAYLAEMDKINDKIIEADTRITNKQTQLHNYLLELRLKDTTLEQAIDAVATKRAAESLSGYRNSKDIYEIGYFYRQVFLQNTNTREQQLSDAWTIVTTKTLQDLSGSAWGSCDATELAEVKSSVDLKVAQDLYNGFVAQLNALEYVPSVVDPTHHEKFSCCASVPDIYDVTPQPCQCSDHSTHGKYHDLTQSNCDAGFHNYVDPAPSRRRLLTLGGILDTAKNIYEVHLREQSHRKN
jgi:hypothetical protein